MIDWKARTSELVEELRQRDTTLKDALPVEDDILVALRAIAERLENIAFELGEIHFEMEVHRG